MRNLVVGLFGLALLCLVSSSMGYRTDKDRAVDRVADYLRSLKEKMVSSEQDLRERLMTEERERRYQEKDFLDQMSMQIKDPCKYYWPCKHQSKCVLDEDDERGFRCECSEGTYGLYCENSTICDSKPCQNGGECKTDERPWLDTFGISYYCLCDWRNLAGGRLCEIADVCSKSPCKDPKFLNCQPTGYSEEGYICYPSYLELPNYGDDDGAKKRGIF